MESEPFKPFGFGIVAYFQLLRRLASFMIIISLAFVPAVLVYANYGDQYSTNESLYGMLAKFSLGSLGESDFMCENHFLQLNRTQKFHCNTGSIQPLKHVGLLPFKEDTRMPYTMDFCGAK